MDILNTFPRPWSPLASKVCWHSNLVDTKQQRAWDDISSLCLSTISNHRPFSAFVFVRIWASRTRGSSQAFTNNTKFRLTQRTIECNNGLRNKLLYPSVQYRIGLKIPKSEDNKPRNYYNGPDRTNRSTIRKSPSITKTISQR